MKITITERPRERTHFGVGVTDSFICTFDDIVLGRGTSFTTHLVRNYLVTTVNHCSNFCDYWISVFQ